VSVVPVVRATLFSWAKVLTCDEDAALGADVALYVDIALEVYVALAVGVVSRTYVRDHGVLCYPFGSLSKR
jgi:hypothetical protein